MQTLKDSFGRTFPYIRLSITDVCNFKCGYCLPNGYQVDKSDNRKFLHLDEIRRLAKALSELGVSKIRLTGGEPTVRKDFFDIVKTIKENSGIKKTVITTNGYHLDKIAYKIKDSGLDGINISIDSLNKEIFKKVTSHDRLDEILRGIKVLQGLNFNNIKINAVLLKGINDSEDDFNQWSNFIEKNSLLPKILLRGFPDKRCKTTFERYSLSLFDNEILVSMIKSLSFKFNIFLIIVLESISLV